MQHIGKCKHSDQRYNLNLICKTAQHQYTRSTTSITYEADPVSEEEAATEVANIIQTPEETTTQVIHVATVEIHNTNTGQNERYQNIWILVAKLFTHFIIYRTISGSYAISCQEYKLEV